MMILDSQKKFNVEALGIIGDKVEDLSDRLIESLNEEAKLIDTSILLRGLSRVGKVRTD